MRELHLFENFVGGNEKERVLLKSWDSTRATFRLAVAAEEPRRVCKYLSRSRYWGMYVEL